MTSSGTRRPTGDATLGSTPSEIAPSETGFAPLHFDASEFAQFVEDESLSEAEASALLRAIWEIVIGCVDLRFGISPIQHLVDHSLKPEKISGSENRAVVESSSISEHRYTRLPTAQFAKVAKEDS